MWQDERSLPFRSAVDSRTNPTYRTLIKNPIDLNIIKTRLEEVVLARSLFLSFSTYHQDTRLESVWTMVQPLSLPAPLRALSSPRSHRPSVPLTFPNLPSSFLSHPPPQFLYTSKKQFVADVTLMVTNCRTYNETRDRQLVTDVMHLERICNQKLQESSSTIVEAVRNPKTLKPNP